MAETTPIPNAGLLALLEQADFGACLVTPDEWRIVYANSAFWGPSGGAERGRGATLFELLPAFEAGELFAMLTSIANGQQSVATHSVQVAGRDLTIDIRRVDGLTEPLLAIVLRSTDVGAIADSHAREGVDPLTGLADRRQFIERLTRLVQGVRSTDQRCAVLFLDLDGFKDVNDAHGHLAGDAVLQVAARRLAACVRAGDLVARFGGDEFVVLLERVTCREEIEPVLRRIERAFAGPVAVGGDKVRLGVSAGAALAGVDGATAEELIAAADRAMYAAKRKSV